MTPDISRHLFHPALVIFVTYFSHPHSACIVEPKLLNDSTVGNRFRKEIYYTNLGISGPRVLGFLHAYF